MKKTLIVLALLLAGCAGSPPGHLICYKLNGEVMYDADVRSVYVAKDSQAWEIIDADGNYATATGDCVYFERVSQP